MKTKIEKTVNNSKIRFILVFICAASLMQKAEAQENNQVQTLFKPDTEFSEAWAGEVKTNSIQGNIGTLVGFYGGVLINRTVLLGISGGVNLSQPEVNYGYFGVTGQYVFRPEKLVHFNTQVVLAYGSTKDYEKPKSGLFDNFWNISGTHFYIFEPGVNMEINIRENLAFCAGLSYRYVTGLNENSESLYRTHVTNHEMSGLNINLGFKTGKRHK